MGGTTGAAMAAIVMIFEMTLDYTVIVPMTLTRRDQLRRAPQPDQGQHLYTQADPAWRIRAGDHARRCATVPEARRE